MKVTHFIVGLGAGGAEAMLYKLVRATRGAQLQHSVISFMDEGVFGARLAAEGVAVTCLGMRAGVPSPAALGAVARHVRRERPDVLQSWMYHADLVAGLVGALIRVPVVWGIHHSDVDPRRAKPLTRWTRLACARLSGALADRIVCCADATLRSHSELGYRADRMVVIPNGFELDRFHPDAAARARIRRELGLSEEALVVGLVARVHPDKDHRGFVAAARRVAERNARAMFVLAGDGASAANGELCRWIDEAHLHDRVRLLGRRSDVPDLLAAVDVLASSSRTEGFPQVLGEAMLCGVPCAATDCGDSREIVGGTGRVVPTSDPAALGAAILDLLALSATERAALGRTARERIRTRYGIEVAAQRYIALYAELARARRRRGARPCASSR